MMRAVASVPPPAPHGTISWIGRLGYWAYAWPPNANPAASSAPRMLLTSWFMTPPQSAEDCSTELRTSALGRALQPRQVKRRKPRLAALGLGHGVGFDFRSDGVVEPEHLDRCGQRLRLLVERLSRSGGLLDQRGVLLRHALHFHDRLVHLLDARALLRGSRSDVRDERADLLHAGDDLLHRAAGAVHQLGAAAHRAGRGVDEALDLLRGLGGALREASHLGRDDRKAAALVAGARRLHGGVEGEDVGLEGDA